MRRLTGASLPRAAGLWWCPALVLAPVLLGCATAGVPWACTPESCAAVVGADLPPAVFGVWQADGGERVEVRAFRTAANGGDIVLSSAGFRLLSPEEDRSGSDLGRITSLDGDVCLAEDRSSAAPDAERRIYRVWLDDTGLHAAALDVTHPGVSQRSDLLRPVGGEGSPAVEYDDAAGVRGLMEELAGDPAAWLLATTFRRTESADAHGRG